MGKGDIAIKKLQVYYFSGTGNALNVAKFLVSLAEENEVEAEMVDISKLEGGAVAASVEDTLLGFSCPTHGFNFPPIMLRFLFKFPRGKSRVFIMNTRAGLKIGKFHLCGLSGVAQLWAAIILKLKGYKIVGMRPVDLPSNWISVHPGLRPKVVESIYERCEKNVRKFGLKMLKGGRGYRALLDIIQDLAISPLALAYYCVGRFVLAKSFIASKHCDMCGLCIKSCPVGAIKVVDKRPYWTLKCESCMRCMNACPKRAIETAHGFVIGTMYLIFVFGLESIYFLTVDRLPNGRFQEFLNTDGLKFLLASALAIPFLVLAYRLVHFFMRYSFFERLIVVTSFTFYKFWRRYKSPQK